MDTHVQRRLLAQVNKAHREISVAIGSDSQVAKYKDLETKVLKSRLTVSKVTKAKLIKTKIPQLNLVPTITSLTHLLVSQISPRGPWVRETFQLPHPFSEEEEYPFRGIALTHYVCD